MTTAEELVKNYFGYEQAVIPEIPDNIRYIDTLNLMEMYSNRKNKELIEFLLEIEAWLTFNQTPDVKNTTALRNDIKKIVEKY
jgi:hypothetical protein